LHKLDVAGVSDKGPARSLQINGNLTDGSNKTRPLREPMKNLAAIQGLFEIKIAVG
jgi:hypothetical protein